MDLNPTQLKDLCYLLDYAIAVTQRQHEPLWEGRARMYKELFQNEIDPPPGWEKSKAAPSPTGVVIPSSVPHGTT
jgi:hypothetical protein